MDLVIVRPKQRVVNPPAGDPDPEPRSLAPSRRETHASFVHALTWREREILELLDARMSNKEIARLLQISYEMVNNYTDNIYQQLQLGSRREAVSHAHGLSLLRIVPRVAEAGA